MQPNELSFNAFSGSAGFVYRPSKSANIYANIGSGWRAPSEFDLYADGVHEGTGRYDRGIITINPSSRPDPERSFNIDLGFRIKHKKFSGEASVFRNSIDNFIYPSPTGEYDSASSLPVYDIVQSKSLLTGFEYDIQFLPVEWLLLSLKGDYVYTLNKQTDNPLPFTPPSKNIFEVKFQKQNLSKLFNPYLSFTAKFVASQTRIDPLEAQTDGYSVFDAGLGFDFVLSKSVTSIDFSVTNISDKKYVDHLSRYKYYAMNPGRSFNLKISVPFSFTK